MATGEWTMGWLILLVPLFGALAAIYYDYAQRARYRRRKRARREHKGVAIKRSWWAMRWLAGRKQKRLEHRGAGGE